MAVLYHAHFIEDDVVSALQQVEIPHERLETGASRKYKAGEDTVKVMTIHASKGLEFPVVAIASIDRLPYRIERKSDDARFLYVARRVTEKLLMAASREDGFVERFEDWETAA